MYVLVDLFTISRPTYIGTVIFGVVNNHSKFKILVHIHVTQEKPQVNTLKRNLIPSSDK